MIFRHSQPEGERVISIVRGEPELTSSRIVSEKRLPEELVSVDLIHEKRVSEKEVSRRVVGHPGKAAGESSVRLLP